MDDRNDFYLADEEPVKKRWVIQKLPIKGGSVLRSAMLSELYLKTPEWVQLDGEIIA